MAAEDSVQSPDRLSAVPPNTGLRRRIVSALKLVQVRMRLPLCLVLAAVVVGRWETIVKYSEALTESIKPQSSGGSAVSSDIEFFCPMDVGVQSNWPGECGICNMTLVQRKKGEAVVLPDGVVARMQISPYQVQLAGIRTAEVVFKPLALSYQALGQLEKAGSRYSVRTSAPAMRLAWLAVGDRVQAQIEGNPSQTPIAGEVVSIASTGEGMLTWESSLAIEGSFENARPGLLVKLTVQKPVAQLEAFRSLPRPIPPLAEGEPRSAYLCPDHHEQVAIEPGECPLDGRALVLNTLASHQRLRWRCARHPKAWMLEQTDQCAKCSPGKLELAVVSYAPDGQAPVVPESAVVDGGSRTTVFVETMEGMFDAVEVVLGPRCGDEYPVLSGIDVGQRVAVSGAFLLDAETRLNPSLAAGYFGGSRTDAVGRKHSAHRSADAAEPEGLGNLTEGDRALAKRQKTCPVTGKLLGSMGSPIKKQLRGQTIFLCCAGCEAKFQENPEEFLEKALKPLQ